MCVCEKYVQSVSYSCTIGRTFFVREEGRGRDTMVEWGGGGMKFYPYTKGSRKCFSHAEGATRIGVVSTR